MKITAYEICDFKRISHVKIDPGDRALVIIGGNNAQGKSSLLDGLTAAFGGARKTDPDPVRHGADRAEITVELDGGALLIRRKIGADGRQQVEIYDESGKRRGPQRVLDELIGARFLDPLKFLHLSPAEQRDALIGCVKWPEGFQYGRWLGQYEAEYDARREANRRAKEAAAAAEAAERERPGLLEVPASVDDLLAQLDRLQAEHEQQAEIVQRAETAAAALARVEDAVEKQRGLVARAQQRLDELLAQAAAAGKAADCAIADATDIDEAATIAEIHTIRAQISEADAKREQHRKLAAKAEAADRAAEQANVTAARAAELDAKVQTLREQRDEAWAAAELPVPGLEWDESQVLLGGVPFQQASNAERLRAALAIAMAMSPQVHDIWVKDGSLLDGDALELVRQVAEERGYRVWLERVGEGDADAIIVRAGELAAAQTEAA